MRRLIWLAALGVGCGGPTFDELNQASTQECPAMTVEGVDVYQGDSPIVWTTVQSSGRAFAFTKASQGNYNKQSNFATNWSTLKSIGMLRGAYHYFDATIDGVAQAQWFLDQVNLAGGIGPGDLPPALDLECPTSPTQSAAGNMCLGNGKSGWAPTATIIQRVWDWLNTVEAATGMKPVIYSYVSWFGDFGFTDPKLTDYPLWIASVSSANCATVPAPWTQATFWQYSSTMPVPGIGTASTAADRDRFMGTQAQLNAFVAADISSDGGTDGMTSTTGMDLTSAPSDLATAYVDLASADLRGGTSSGDPKAQASGCELGSAERSSPGSLALALLLVALLGRGRVTAASNRRRPRYRTARWCR